MPPAAPASPRFARLRSCFTGCAVLLLGLGLLGLLGWGGYSLVNGYFDSLTPRIDSIPPLFPGSTEMSISGINFGATGRAWLYLPGEQARRPLEVLSWESRRIFVRLPDQTAAGQVEIEADQMIGSRSSSRHDFITTRPRSDDPNARQVPTQPGSPWPTFRHDSRNTGNSSLAGGYHGASPWTFSTAKGIFNTPVIDSGGTIYIGSADHFLYALNPDGSLSWKYETGEIIDSAAALYDARPENGEAPLVFISGDGSMYGFKTGPNIPDPADRLVWRYEAELRPEVSFNRWFEGNVAVGPDGTLFAGNTNFLYYAISPSGQKVWTYPTASNNWSQAAFGADGTIFWGSNDTFIRAVSPSGRELWRVRTLGFIAASAAVGSDGTVYIGSFDSSLYAVDPLTGSLRWTFPTQDHIYSSAALGQDSRGSTNAIYFGSADGSFYALRPDGSLIWRYDTGDPIRSSPAVGLGPDGREIIYFGSGNGKLYALNSDGSLRWSYDTTPADPELQDRNDLNGSPALSENGVLIGGEHGSLVFVPYDYCLTAGDPRCATASADLASRLGGPGAMPGSQSAELYYVTPGGSTLTAFPASLPAANLITLRLVVVNNGQTQAAYVCNSPLGCPASDLEVKFSPALDFQLDHSADGRYIYIRPLQFLIPGVEYSLAVRGRYFSGGLRLGNITLLSSAAGFFESTFRFQAAPADGGLPLQVGPQQTSALEWTRLAAPLPPMLPSLNQIGFDYLDWIIGTVAVTPPDGYGGGQVILWAIGGKRGPDGILKADPDSDLAIPLSGEYQDDAFLLANQNFKMAITGIPIPFNRFELRGQLGQDGVMKAGAAAFADTDTLSIPSFGPYLVIAGLANNLYQKLLVAGTYITRPYPPAGPANQAPPGVSLDQFYAGRPTPAEDGRVSATFRLEPGAAYPLGEHRPALLLVDAQNQTAVSLDYQANLTAVPDENGNLKAVSLRLPAGLVLPERVRVYILLDVFPLTNLDFDQ